MFKIRYTFFPTLLLVLLVIVMTAGRVSAYIMPTEQLLFLMGMNFSRFKTLIITQSTHLEYIQVQDTEVVLNEKIWLKVPDLYRAETSGAQEGPDDKNTFVQEREPGGDMFFRRLLMANDLETVFSLLSSVEVNTEFVSLMRFEGVGVYRLGDADPESSKLLIAKDTFLPILFCYQLQRGPDAKIVTVRFSNYQKQGKCWYPYEITYCAGEEILERYVIGNLQINSPVEQPLSEIVIEKTYSYPSFESSDEDERLREIIDLLKKKYH